MRINKILNSLENHWERDDILLKIKNGLDTDEIINEFLENNKVQIKELHTLLRSEDKDLFNQVEQLSTCEAKLINKISNLKYTNNNQNYDMQIKKKISTSNNASTKKISLFMINWSNKFVIIFLLIISAIALSKQAWA